MFVFIVTVRATIASGVHVFTWIRTLYGRSELFSIITTHTLQLQSVVMKDWRFCHDALSHKPQTYARL